MLGMVGEFVIRAQRAERALQAERAGLSSTQGDGSDRQKGTWPDKYAHMDDITAFGFLANALDGGGDVGASFPRSDAEDMSRGCRFIPGEVTLARRAGRQVQFVSDCGQCCWYWQFEDGHRVYHYDPLTYAEIGRHNHGVGFQPGELLAGPCPRCGNEYTSGGSTVDGTAVK